MLDQTTIMRAGSAGSRLRPGLVSTVAGLALCLTAFPSRGANLQITCEQETVGVPGWTAPLVVTYAGGETGTLSVKSDHVELWLDATYRVRPEDGAKVIDGAADVAVIMPDLALLDACTAARVPADFKDDGDLYFVTSTSCLGETQPSAEPVPIRASVSVGLLPTEDAIIEIRRTYQAPSAGPGGSLYIETYPANCKLDAGR